MGKLKIRREESMVAAFKDYSIYLDDVFLDHSKNKEEKEYQVENTHHTLYLKNEFLGSGLKSNRVEFDMLENSEIEIICFSKLFKASGIKLEIDKIKRSNVK